MWLTVMLWKLLVNRGCIYTLYRFKQIYKFLQFTDIEALFYAYDILFYKVRYVLDFCQKILLSVSWNK
jgi:hypothetical protein